MVGNFPPIYRFADSAYRTRGGATHRVCATELAVDRVMEVLPALHSILLEGKASGSAAQALDQFITARQLSGHPVTVQQLL